MYRGSEHLNEPLLTVNRPSALPIEAVPTSTHIKHDITTAWRKLKISMIAIFSITFLAIGILIYGCIMLAQASNNSRAMFDSLVSDISSFSKGGYKPLKISNFSVSFDTSIVYHFAHTIDPNQYFVDKSSGNMPYNSTVFQAHISLNDSFPVAHSRSGSGSGDGNGSNSNSGNSDSNIIVFVVSYIIASDSNNTNIVAQGKFEVQVPYYQLESAVCSLHQGERDCVNAGGYFNKSANSCTKLFVLTQVCAKVVYDPNNTRWDLDESNGGSGCIYPFHSHGIFVQHNYTPNVTDLLANTTDVHDFFIRSSADPYISLQALTSGKMSIDGVFQTTRNGGLNLIAVACATIVVLVSIGTAFFFLKRKIKRDYKKASRIPNHYSRPPMYRYLALSLVTFGISVGIGFPLLGHWSLESTWSYTPFVGLILIIWFGPVSIISMLIFCQMLLKTTQCGAKVRYFMCGLVGSAIVALCAFAVGILIKPWDLQADYLQAFLGTLIVLSLFPFAVLLLFMSVRSIAKHSVASKDHVRTMVSREIISHRAPSSKNFATLGLSVLLVVFVATAYLPPIWNVPTVGYNLFQSPYSLIQPGPSNIAVLKLYMDVVVFYGFILFVVAMAVLASVSKRVRKVFNYWFRFRIGGHSGGRGNWRSSPSSSSSSSLSLSTTIDTSLGEVGFLLLVLVLAVWWFWWWYAGYGRIASITDTLERLARVLGHMCNLFASLLLFPVTRNSMWVELLGIPFERAIQYHRWAGLIVFIALTGHMLVWWINWGVNGTLWHNIFSVQNIPDLDNWSIPIMELTWLGAAIMVLLSQSWFRRRRFELFYYTHHFFIVFFITGLIHSWSMWYFTGGGMILWFIDRMIRYYKSARTFTVVSVQPHNNGDTTQITLLLPNGFLFRAGQYAFINIPSITPLEWHPFTISSSPGDATLTFHIKNMGKNTWTARLARIYGGGGDSPSFIPLNSIPIVNIDGPYGNPPSFITHPNIVLVAGGIGITPMISILKDQQQLQKHNHPCTKHLKNIYLLWVVRDLSILEMFREVFDDISNDSFCKSKFHIMLRVTQRSFSKPTETTPFNPAPILGRPNIQQEFADIATVCGSDVLIMVCGPPSMVKEVQNAAYKLQFELHVETFEL